MEPNCGGETKRYGSKSTKNSNRQARAITGVFTSTPIGITVKEAGLRPAISLLNNRQRRYTQRLLGLPISNDTQKTLPETLRDGDAHAQPGEQDAIGWDWLSNYKAKQLSHRLANSLVKGTDFDSTFGIECTEIINVNFLERFRFRQGVEKQ